MNGWEHNDIARKVYIHLKQGPLSLIPIAAGVNEPLYHVATAIRQLMREGMVGSTIARPTGNRGRRPRLYHTMVNMK